jgi:hypothetical protein
MTSPVRVKRDFPRPSGGFFEHHWMLVGPDGVLTFCTVDTTADGDAVCVDGAWWAPWGITAHIPAVRCSGDCECHDITEGCKLLEGVRCCVAHDSIMDCRELLVRWLDSGRDDTLIWAELDRRYDWSVTPYVVGGDR